MCLQCAATPSWMPKRKGATTINSALMKFGFEAFLSQQDGSDLIGSSHVQLVELFTVQSVINLCLEPSSDITYRQATAVGSRSIAFNQQRLNKRLPCTATSNGAIVKLLCRNVVAVMLNTSNIAVHICQDAVLKLHLLVLHMQSSLQDQGIAKLGQHFARVSGCGSCELLVLHYPACPCMWMLRLMLMVAYAGHTAGETGTASCNNNPLSETCSCSNLQSYAVNQLQIEQDTIKQCDCRYNPCLPLNAQHRYRERHSYNAGALCTKLNLVVADHSCVYLRCCSLVTSLIRLHGAAGKGEFACC